MKKMDAMRQFIIGYPRWEDFNIRPSRGIFNEDFTAMSVGWFQSSSNISQLALEYYGSSIMRTGSDPVRAVAINGYETVTRQANFSLLLLQNSDTSGVRADTSEFLLDFVEWVDDQDRLRKVPVFGDDPKGERTWATSGVHLADWDDKTREASVYQVLLHKIYTKTYEPIFE